VSAARLTASICALAMLGALACAGPAAATETGVVTAPGQTVTTVDKAADLGVGWVRLFVGWKDIEPAKGAFNEAFVVDYAREVAAFRARGVKVLFVVTGSPLWASGSPTGFGAPTNPADYAAFIDHLAAAIPGVGAWEIWNEADGNLFWENGPNPPAYAALLRAAYPVIKARDPNAIVVSTGMVGADFDFLQAIYDNGAQGYFDAVGVHTDHACLLTPPGSFYREADGRVGRFAFTGYREIHYLMTLHGDGAKPIWMSELGWNTQSTAADSCRDGSEAGRKPAGVTEAAQAANLTAAYRCLAADPFVTVTMWFSLQDTPGSAHYDGHLGLLRADGSAKPAYAAMKALRNGANITPDPGCGGLLDHEPPGLAVLRPSNGLQFVDLLSLQANAVDTPGGAGMSTVELLADGTRVVKSKGGTFRLDPWFRAGQRLGLGPHTLTFRARDNAGNVTEQAVAVTKVLPSQLAPISTRLTLRASARSGRRVRLAGNLTHAPSELPEGGRIYISLERRSGGRYRRVKQVSATARRPFARILRVPGTGRFRALARYKGAAPFRASRSPHRSFTSR
jgi:hypothetical protein